MSTTKSILERVQCLPIELIREIKCTLDPEIQIDLLKNNESVYGRLNKTINQKYFKKCLIQPSMRALQSGLRKHSTRIHTTIQNKFGDFEISNYCINCELPSDVIQNMYYSNIRKPILKALKDAKKEAPVICDLDGKMKSCVTPLENKNSRVKLGYFVATLNLFFFLSLNSNAISSKSATVWTSIQGSGIATTNVAFPKLYFLVT